jgi:hypothetical protein
MLTSSRTPRGPHGPRRAQEETLLLVSSRERLTARYGEHGFETIQDSLKQFGSGLSQKGVRLVVGLVDDARSLSAVGAAPVKRITAASVKGVVDVMRQKVSGRSKSPVSVLILGGHEVIPCFKLANPAPDSDAEVLSDNPYGSRPGMVSAEKCLLPDVPVGRMPDGDGSKLGLLTGQLGLAALTGKRPTRAEAGDDRSLKYTAAVWQRASREVATGLGWKGALKVCPPLTYLRVKAGWFEGKTLLYFNLHGSDREPYWFGQFAEKYPTALSPRNVTNFSRGTNVVVTEACYGAIEAGRRSETSMALAFLATGTPCFVGSTCVAYGALVPPVSEADLIALHFFRSLQKGMTTGRALVTARAHLAAVAVSGQGYLDEDDKKTLLQFVLFGDPTLRPAWAF